MCVKLLISMITVWYIEIINDMSMFDQASDTSNFAAVRQVKYAL